MISNEMANRFAENWVAAWNAHDIDKVFEHYVDDFTIETPIAAKIVPESKGIIQGKHAIRAYWEKALAQIPDLRFELVDVLLGINGLTIYYLNTVTDRKSAEVLTMNEQNLVTHASVYYTQTQN